VIKNLLSAVILLLAINFIAIGGGVGWMWSSHHLDPDKVKAIKAILFAPATQPATQPAVASTQPSADPMKRLELLLAKESGHTPAEQMDYMRQAFEQQMAELDRRESEIADLKRQTDIAQDKLTRDRAALSAEQQSLTASQQQASTLADDKGFQDSLELYTTMQPKQVKNIFAGLDDATVTSYLHAMDTSKAAKIIKEFKSPAETARIQKIIERIRLAEPSTAPTASAAP
jgi:hypothetical protein